MQDSGSERASRLSLRGFKVRSKLTLLVVLFTLVITTMVGYTIVFATSVQKDDGLLINLAGRQRMLTQKLTKEFFLAVNTASQNQASMIDLSGMTNTRKLFDTTLDAMIKGGSSYLDLQMQNPVALPSVSQDVIDQLQTVKQKWQQHIQRIEDYTLEKGSGELEQISTSSLDVLKAMNTAVVMLAQASDQHVFEMERNQVIIAVIALIVSITISTLLANSIVTPLNRAVKNTKRIARGDLKRNRDSENALAQAGSQSELAALVVNVEDMRSALHDVIVTVQKNSRQMAHSAEQVTNLSSEISDTGKIEKESSHAVLEAIGSLNEISQVVSEHISTAVNLSEQAQQEAEHGIQVVNQSISELETVVGNVSLASDQMSELKSFSEQISEITQSINEIASQTNLLALNAAIEAARAGEQGRGFAVVADEVRGLAVRTSTSSNEIAELIGQLINKVEESVLSMSSVVESVHASKERSSQTVGSFNAMATGVKDTTSSAKAIAEYNGQQSQNLSNLEEQLTQLFKVLEEGSGKATAASFVAQDLYAISDTLENHMRRFETDDKTTIDMQDGELRSQPRVDTKLRVKVMQGERIEEGLTEDISLNGMKLRSRADLTQGQQLTLEIQLPYELASKYKSALKLHADIVHYSMDDGINLYGVQFEHEEAVNSEILKELFTFFKQPHDYS